MFCTQCGKKAGDFDKFCGSCGSSLVVSKDEKNVVYEAYTEKSEPNPGKDSQVTGAQMLKKIIGFTVGAIIVFAGVMIIGGIRVYIGTKNIGAVPALMFLAIIGAAAYLAGEVYRKITRD